jgi:hypothetical protein
METATAIVFHRREDEAAELEGRLSDLLNERSPKLQGNTAA